MMTGGISTTTNLLTVDMSSHLGHVYSNQLADIGQIYSNQPADRGQVYKVFYKYDSSICSTMYYV